MADERTVPSDYRRYPMTEAPQARPTYPARLVLLVLMLLGAGPADVVRVQVPADKVSAWFPPGTALRVLSVEQFERLVKEAQEAVERSQGRTVPRLLRGRHVARWDAGVLIGRSELLVEPSSTRAAELAIDPWTPAVDRANSDRSPLRSHAQGQTALWIESGATKTIRLEWQLRARPGSDGRGFTLGLPGVAASMLELDLPAGWIPEGPDGISDGPTPSSESGRHTWRFDGRGGLVDLVLHEPAGSRDGSRDPRTWVAGPTRIELSETSARWVAQWTVNVEPRGPRRLVVALDPSLEFLGASGADVVEARAEEVDSGTRVNLRFDDRLSGSTTVSLRALAHVPGEGPWTVPAARPLDAVWTGGTTSIRLDATRVLSDCRELSGHRVFSRPGEAFDASLLTFEAAEPRSVAVLGFSRPRSEASVDVRGQLFLGNTAPRLDCQLAWRVQRGRILALDVDFPSVWLPDSVRLAGVDEPLSWQSETLPGGDVRVHVVAPSGDLGRDGFVLRLSASAKITGGRGPLSLPRVRPVGARIADERWVAWTEPGMTLQPTAARGVAWIDPALVIGRPSDRVDAPPGMHEALAWRWIAERAEARVDRDRAKTEVSASAVLTATVEPERLRLDWRIAADGADQPLSTIPVAISDGPGAPLQWRFTDESTGVEVLSKPLNEAAQRALGFLDSGEARELTLPRQRASKVVLHAQADIPWKGRGRLPLLVLPEQFQSRNLVVIELARDLRSRVEATGLQRIDPGAAEAMATEKPAVKRRARYRVADAFVYSRPGGHLDLQTESLHRAAADGVIDNAVLTTVVDFDGPSHHHLALRVSSESSSALNLAFPAGTVLVRVRRDGQEIRPTDAGTVLSIPLPNPSSARSFSTIGIDYLTPPRDSHDPTLVRPERPTASLPYLALRWELLVPEPWTAADQGSKLVRTDPTPVLAPLERLLGSWRAPRGRSPSVRRSALDVETLRALDRRVADTRNEEVTLLEWLTRWDAGPTPLVIDRMTLDFAGWGPRSRIIPSRNERSPEGAARAALRPLGLTVVPLGGALLVTTLAEAPDRSGGPLEQLGARAAWEQRVHEAIAWGADASDRFQSIAQWRSEATPKGWSSSESPETGLPSDGHRIFRFSAAEWPETGTYVRLVDEGRQVAWAWVSGLFVLVLGVGSRRVPVRARAIGLSIVLLAASLSALLGPPRVAVLAAAAAAGSVAVFFFWLGCSLPTLAGVRFLPRRPPGSSWLRASGSAASAFALVGLALAAGAARLESAPISPERPILALFPFDGPPDPARRPNRVVLRIDDYERLERLANPSPLRRPTEAVAIDASHHVAWAGERDLVVKSDFTLVCPEHSDATWEFPIDEARDIEATLDGANVLIQLRAGGKDAVVSLSGSGPHRLHVRRTFAARRTVRGESVAVSINPVASTRVVVSATPDRKIELPTARGKVEERAAAVSANLGPTGKLEVLWSKIGASEPPLAGSVDGMLLWDAEPAGDRIRARLTYRNPDGTAELRLRLAPGIVVRSGSIPGTCDTTWRGSADRPEWVVHVDPPLPDGTTVPLEFWRPAQASAHGEGLPARSLPLIEPVGVEHYSGAVAFRRPADWSGRLAPGSAVEPISEEVFVRTWGALPEEPLTLSGTSRFLRTPELTVQTGPTPPKLAVEPVVQLDLRQGRVDLELKADLVEQSGPCEQAELELPAECRIIRVDADGLTEWHESSRRLRLRFDGAPARRRSVRIEGWIPVPADPLASGVAGRSMGVPWPRWLGVESRPGTLIVIGPSPPQLENSPGAVPVQPSSQRASAPPDPRRATYRIERPEGLGRLTWTAEPPRVGVEVRSQVTIHPESAEWVASLRFDVSGGAYDAIHLKLPAVWAGSAEAKLVGETHQLTTETRGGSSFWTLRPDRPIWGTQRLVIRAIRPLARGETLDFPEINPLGRGLVDSYLALVIASGREVAIEGSPGLQPIEDRSRFLGDEFEKFVGMPFSQYRVRADGWSLKVEPPLSTRSREDSGAAPRVRSADIECVFRGDGSVLGSVRYEVEPRSSPFLTVGLPERSQPLWASVDGSPTRPLRAASGRWLIALDEDSASEVLIVWQADPPAPGMLWDPLESTCRHASLSIL